MKNSASQAEFFSSPEAAAAVFYAVKTDRDLLSVQFEVVLI